MAIIRLGHLVGGISGNIGSANFANTRNGTVVRRRPTRSDRSSEKQLFRRSRYMLFKTQWDNLTSDEKDAWHTQARQVPFQNRLGKSFTLSGWQYWMTCALSVPHNLDSMPTTPPATTRPPPLLTLSANFFQGGPMNITTTVQPPVVFRALHLHIARPMSSTIPRHFRNWLYAGWLSTNIDTRDWNNSIEQFIGLLQAGEVIGIKMYTRTFAAMLGTPLIIATTVQDPP